MSDCLGCQRCEDGPMVTLISGRQVCDFCPEWKLECEARELLKMPLAKRRAALERRERERGKSATDELRDMMTAVWMLRGGEK